MNRRIAITMLLIFSACSAVNQQKALPQQPDELVHKNLRVLPPNIPHEELLNTMRGFTRALGVRCSYCHVVTAEEPKVTYEFFSDLKPEKSAARIMISMTKHINQDFISRMPEQEATVSCMTCHRGKPIPELEPAAAVPEKH